MSYISDKNRADWEAGADGYSARFHAEAELRRLADDPWRAFHPAVREILRAAGLPGARVLVPSSGDNHAVFALAMLGARVTSADISQKQLDNAARAAERIGVSGVEFMRADTMALEGIPSGAFDFAYTSNGVHVWISDLDAMYRSVARCLRPGGKYLLFEIHPFNRPFDDDAKIRAPYDAVGPFEDETTVTFHWRVMDILGAMLRAGLNLRDFREMFAEKRYDDPFWVPMDAQVKDGYREYDRVAVDRMYDWRENPIAALPQWMCALAEKGNWYD